MRLLYCLKENRLGGNGKNWILRKSGSKWALRCLLLALLTPELLYPLTEFSMAILWLELSVVGLQYSEIDEKIIKRNRWDNGFVVFSGFFLFSIKLFILFLELRTVFWACFLRLWASRSLFLQTWMSCSRNLRWFKNCWSDVIGRTKLFKKWLSLGVICIFSLINLSRMSNLS